jgi:hypothetical protein
VHTLFPQQQQQVQGQHGQQQQQQQQLRALSLLEQACCRQLQAASRRDGQFIANCLYGFARCQHPVPVLFSALLPRLGFNYCQQLQSQHVVMACWALAKLGHYDAALTARLLWRAVVVRNALQTHSVGLLLWSAGKLGHAADPTAIAQLLQAFKQHAGKARGKDVSLVLYGLQRLGLLQQHRAWLLGGLLQLVLLRLQDMQPAGVATLLSVLLEMSRGEAATATAAGHEQQQPQQGVAVVGFNLHSSSSSSSSTAGGDTQAGLLAKRLQQPASASPAAAAATTVYAAAPRAATSAEPYSSRLLDPRHMAPLYREVARHIAAQLQATTPQTLASISLSLAGLGYYDARLYTRLAAALAAAAEIGVETSNEDVQQLQQVDAAAEHYQTHQQQQQGDGTRQPPYTTQQCWRLLCMFSHYQHPAPAVWHVLLPALAAEHAATTDSSSSSLQPRVVVQLLAASTVAGCAGDGVVLQGLLQLAVAVLQQHAASLQVTDLVQLAAAGTWLLNAAQQQQQQQQQVTSASAVVLQPLLGQLDRHLHRLLPRLVSAVLSQPQCLPPQHLPKLLEAATQLQCSSSNSSSGSMWGSEEGDSSSSKQLSHHQQQHYHHSSQHVGQRQLQRLSDLAVEHLGCWQPAALVTLLHCHTQPPLFDPLLAEAYAEELLPRLGQASVQVLLQLISTLAASVSQQGSSYSHSQLHAAALRQLHGRLLLATEQQLREAVLLLEALQQQEGPVHRAAVRLLEGWAEPAAAAAAAGGIVRQWKVAGVHVMKSR